MTKIIQVIFDEKVELYGRQKMRDQVAKLRKLRQNALETCVVNGQMVPEGELNDKNHLIRTMSKDDIIGGYRLKDQNDVYCSGGDI